MRTLIIVLVSFWAGVAVDTLHLEDVQLPAVLAVIFTICSIGYLIGSSLFP